MGGCASEDSSRATVDVAVKGTDLGDAGSVGDEVQRVDVADC